MAAVAAVGLALSVAQTLFSTLQTKEVRELCSKFDRESELVKLKATMTTIKAVLHDVEFKRQGLTEEGEVWVENLKDAVYDFDDLLDNFIVAQQIKQDAKLTEKVKHFFSPNNLFHSKKVSKEIKLLKEKLEGITKNHTDFGLTANVTKPVKLREETCSVISELEVIGREDDIKTIVDMLLSGQDHSSDKNVSYVSIVGVGGLGKTTLAQLVYNDESVKRAFKNRIWVCVSDDHDKEFKINEILGKMLGIKDVSHQTLQQLQKQARTLLEKEKYLLVLDDVWNENPVEWMKLKPFFVSDVSGSKIIVTTRSKKVASSIGEDSTIYELSGLSEENSWSLFKRIAFGKRVDQVNTDLVEIAEDIVKKCGNVPLSIRVTASLLYDLDKSKWKLFRDSELAKLWRGNEDDSVMSTLMFSYYNLSSELKSCFSFCSLFPKDYNLKKKVLIGMWLAQGFLVATHDHESIEDVGERYFTILLNRCFFQDIELDEHGEVDSCKMHDLMHDLALEVAGNESSIITPANKNHLRNEIRHISIDDSCLESNLCIGNAWRTFISLSSSVDINALLSKGIRLRVLHLSRFSHATLPDLFGELLHLRYLDLSSNHELEMLPKSITKLHNLQILKLTWCNKLKELPEKTSRLVNLRTLDVDGCDSLTHMPRGVYNLKNLHTLPEFVVGGVDSKQVQGSKLVDLQALTSLKGDLCIRIRHFKSCNMPRATETALKLKDAHKLEIICDGVVADLTEVHETLAEQVCPNDDIGIIKMQGYQGMKMPSWASMLVSVKVSSVKGLQYVTSSLSQLCHLKVVELLHLPNVECIESEAAWELVSRPNNNNESKIVVFFPVLEKLVLKEMPKLKGWWREVRWEEMDGCLAGSANDGIQEHASVTLPCFPRLRELYILRCESMMYFPPCPYLKELYLREVNEALTFCKKKGSIVASGVTSMLVNVKVSNIKGLQQEVTSSLSQLCHLKVLELVELPNVEYIESEAAWELVSRPNDNNESKKVVFFPALEKLVLEKMPKLKGWWREVRWEEMDGCLADDGGIQEHASVTLPCFPRLRELQIWRCESMMYFPPCPYLKKLHLENVNKALTFCNKKGSIVASGVTSISRPFSSDSTSSSSDVLWFLEKLKIWDERVMNSVSKEFVGGVVHMVLFCPKGNNKEGMQLVKEGFERCGSSLQHLEIIKCGKLREIGIEQLSNLQSLRIMYYNESEEEEGMPWKNLQSLSSLTLSCCNEMVELPKGLRYLGTSLQSLEFWNCHKMEKLGETIGFLTSLQSLDFVLCSKLKALPESLKFLTSLRHLRISSCDQVNSLPEAMCHLTSLHTLDISYSDSDELKKRCQPDGEDWPKICHIPNIK